MAKTAIEDLKLQGNVSNLNRALRRERSEPLAPDDVTRIAAIDALIDKTLKSAAKGATRNKKKNPASGILLDLIRAKSLILQARKPEKPKQPNVSGLDEIERQILSGKTN